MSGASEQIMNGVVLHHGDCLDVLAGMPECSVDAVVCDPPYGLGFMGKHWDHAESVAFRSETWAAVLRALKPGGHLVAFSGTRTYHRMVVAIEDAGFEVRDQLAWVFGSGFPKSHNLPGGFGTALKPAYEPIVLARKPLSEPTVAANVLRWRTGALNIDATRVVTGEARPKFEYFETGSKRGYEGGIKGGAQIGETTLGRWPANLAHDGSDDVLAGFPQTKSGAMKHEVEAYDGSNVTGFLRGKSGPNNQHGDSGSAARFFYCAKANKTDRIGSKHPTVKPIALMRWLVRMVTPPGGTVLDPFAGTGTTGQAAVEEGFKAILIEREDEYVADIRARLCRLEKQEALV